MTAQRQLAKRRHPREYSHAGIRQVVAEQVQVFEFGQPAEMGQTSVRHTLLPAGLPFPMENLLAVETKGLQLSQARQVLHPVIIDPRTQVKAEDFHMAQVAEQLQGLRPKL